VCARHWYDKSKHIFPASRWEVYDPEKDYSNYTVKWGTCAAWNSTKDAVQLCCWSTCTPDRHQHLALVNIACWGQLLKIWAEYTSTGQLLSWGMNTNQLLVSWGPASAYMYWQNHASCSSVPWSRRVVLFIDTCETAMNSIHFIPSSLNMGSKHKSDGCVLYL